MKRLIGLSAAILFAVFFLTACDSAPQVGSDAWCAAMDAKPKSAWTLEETGQYAKHCVLGVGTVVGSEEWCQEMDTKPKGDWTANEAADYAKHCVL